MARIDPSLGADSTLRTILGRAWASMSSRPVPDYPPPAGVDVHEAWLRRLDRVRDTLEQARVLISRDGWTSGAWFTVRHPSGGTRPAKPAEAFALLPPSSEVVNGCLVGTLLRLAEDPDTAPSVADVWDCVDELYEAMHERSGHVSHPAGRVFSPGERTSRLRGLTTWNDAPGRTSADLLELLDRAISRTIVAACRG
jgi:hypothetical protein